jgi:hypothetical protein
MGYNEHIGAVAAIASQHLEEALTQSSDHAIMGYHLGGGDD